MHAIPDAMVLCQHPERTRVNGYPDFAIPTLPRAIGVFEAAAQLTNPAVRGIGISLNTSGLSFMDRAAALSQASSETGLPACDPVAGDVGPLVDQLFDSLVDAA